MNRWAEFVNSQIIVTVHGTEYHQIKALDMDSEIVTLELSQVVEKNKVELVICED